MSSNEKRWRAQFFWENSLTIIKVAPSVAAFRRNPPAIRSFKCSSASVNRVTCIHHYRRYRLTNAAFHHGKRAQGWRLAGKRKSVARYMPLITHSRASMLLRPVRFCVARFIGESARATRKLACVVLSISREPL